MKISKFLLSVFIISAFFITPSFASAAITEQGPPMNEAMFDTTVGPGSIIPLAQFMLDQSSGEDTLDAIGFYINASTTMTQGEISRVSLWKESGTSFGFQIEEDTFIEGAASTSPMVDGTLIVLTPTTGVSVNSGTDFFVVATTTSTANITNNHGFDVSFDNNYASTTSGGVGTAYSMNNKFILSQTLSIKISEVQVGSSGNADNEFIEIYNISHFPINLQDAGMALHIFDGSGTAGSKLLSYYNEVIPGQGFFLMGSETNYDNSTTPVDASYSTLSGNTLVSNGGLSIATSTNISNAVSSAIDLLGWGTQTNGKEGTALADLLDGLTLERKATTTADAASMTTGDFLYKGNGSDTDDNSVDFVLQLAANPQNSLSSPEFPFSGFGGGDISAPRVLGSYPSDGMVDVPVDISYIGFDFSKMVSTSTVISAVATSTVTLFAQGSLTNLCTSVAYTPGGTGGPPAKCILSASLAPSTTYTFTATSTIFDFSNNALDQDMFAPGNQPYSISFTTGNSTQTMTNTIPPNVTGTYPFPGSASVPTNIAKLFVKFNQEMSIASLNASTVTLFNTTDNIVVNLSGETFALDSTNKVLSITLGSSLTANKNYALSVSSQVQNLNNIFMAGAYMAPFVAGSSADNSAPSVLGTMPIANGATGIQLGTTDIVFIFDDNIDMTTATSGSVTLSTGGSNMPGAVSYDPVSKEGHFTANNLLPANSTMVLTLVGPSLKNVSGIALGSDYTMSFTTEAVNSDSTAPSIIFANADEFGLAVTFDESIKSTDATNLDNYALTLNNQDFTLSSMAGHSVAYDAQTRTAKLFGFALLSGSSFTITGTNIRDISSNQMTSSSFSGTVLSAAASGGFLGPGDMNGDFGPMDGSTFSSGGIGGFMPPVEVRPFSTFKNASTTYGFEIPIAQKIPVNGQIVITFPSSSDFGISSVATTSSTYFGGANSDINGPGPGSIGIKTITSNTGAKTVTLTLDTATRSELMGGSIDTHDFLRFDLLDIKNPSIPKGPDSSGYTLDIKTKDASGTLLESLTPSPVYITGGSFGGSATTTIRGQILGSNGNYGLNGVTVRLDSFITGPMTTDTSNSMWGSSDGEFEFTDLPVGNEYMLFTKPLVNPTGTSTGYFGTTMPSPLWATSSDIHLRNITLTATSSAVTFTVKLTASSATFGASEKIDVFAGGPGQFTVQTVTPGSGSLSATTIASLSLPQQNGMWNIGIGPAMPKDGMFTGPPPSVAWQMPKPIDIQMSGCPSACFTTIDSVSASDYTFNVSTADKTISGILKDGNDNIISNGMIFAYSPQQGVGTQAQSSSAGTFTLNVGEGTYNVGSFFPGMGQSKEVPVEVNSSGVVYVDGTKTASTGSSGANPFVLKMIKPSYTITGRVTDGSNGIPNASVSAYRTDGPGYGDAMTDSTGNYTLYVDNGSWNVGGYLPGYGPMTEQAVAISGANQENVNFAPSGSTTYHNVTGTVFESSDSIIDSGEGIDGVMVSVRSTTGSFYETKTGNDGTYTLRVPQGNDYRLNLFKPGYGAISFVDESLNTITAFSVTSTTTKNVRINSRQTITINVKDSFGNFMNIPELFIDLFDMNQNSGNFVEIINASSTSVQIMNGASTTVRVFSPSIPQNSLFVSSDDAGTLVLDGVLEVNGSETIKVVVNTNLRTISGTTYHTEATSGNELSSVWIEVFDVSSGMHYGSQATTTDGTYTLKLADGTYKITSMKPGYTMAPQDMIVSADLTGQNLVMSSAGSTISGSVIAGGVAAPNAFVRAEKVGGGFAVTKTDTDGNYSLSVDDGSWRIFAASERYTEAAYGSNPVSVSTSATSIDIALTNAASIQDKIITSATFSDTSSGSLHDETINVDVVVDSGALGQGGSSSYITAKETANFTETPGIDVIADKAKDISAYSGSSQVKNLSSGKNATIDLTYTVAELATSGIDTPAEVVNLSVSAWSEDSKQWESLSTVATYKDSDGNAIAVATTTASIPGNVAKVTFTTNEASHFSPYALTNATDPSAPDTPSGLSASASSANSITVSWSANTESDLTGYYLYRDTDSSGSFPLLTTISESSYDDTGLPVAATYYYKIAAYDNSGYESSASVVVSATTNTIGGGGFLGSVGFGGTSPTPVVVAASGIDSKEDTVTSSEEIIDSSTVISGEEIKKEDSVDENVNKVKAVSVSAVFKKTLRKGATSNDVKRLQELLATDSEVYPDGLVTGYFGTLTRKAVMAFQQKYNIVFSGNEDTTGYGLVGPSTRAKLAEVFSNAKPKFSTITPSTKAFVSPVFNYGLGRGARNANIERLQQLLNSDPETMIANEGAGSTGNETEYFGRLTEKAVQKFQRKYNVAQEGDSGYGYVGPKTRAKLREVFSSSDKDLEKTSSVVTPPAEVNVSTLETQIQQLVKQIEALQLELQNMQ